MRSRDPEKDKQQTKRCLHKPFFDVTSSLMRAGATKRPARRFRVSRTLSDEVRLCQRAVSTVCLKVETPSRRFTIPILALCN
jgi:hypothetical protein